MNAFVIGAGMSATAKYPLTRNLFREVDEFVNTWVTDDLKRRWAAFKGWLEKGSNFPVAQAWREKNIEYILTAMDLYLVLKEAIEKGMLEGSPLAAETWNRKGNMLEDISEHRSVVSKVLNKYFEFRHWQDAKPDFSSRRETIRRFCRDKLKRGDVIVTFNYDSTLERTLREDKRWQPWDGFGFDVQPESPFDDKERQKDKPSEVRILHLHGSVGWKVVSSGSVSLSNPFLSWLGEDSHDANWTPGPSEPVLIEPSFLKRFESDVVLEVWHMAARELHTADEVYVLGYSLPDADSAAAVLLITTCREKATKGGVVVVNRSNSVLLRFEKILPGCKRLQKTLEEWTEGDV